VDPRAGERQMSNMSYCRFENTSSDVADCKFAIDEAIDEGKTLAEFKAELSSDQERHGFNRMVRHCRKFLELVDEMEGGDSEHQEMPADSRLD
jgi:hypothetical protein